MSETSIYVAMVGFTLLLVGAFVLAWHRERERRRRVRRAWELVAEKIGGTYDAGLTGARDQFGEGMAIAATVGGVDLYVTSFEDPAQVAAARALSQEHNLVRVPDRHVVIVAETSAPSEVALKVFPDDMPGAARPGFQDVGTGDEAFDHAFVVKATDEVIGRAWINSTVRKYIRVAPGYAFHLRHGKAVGIRFVPGMPEDPVVLENAIRAVAAFADGRHEVVRQFKKVAKRLGGKARKHRRRWARVAAKVDGVQVKVDTFEEDGAHFNVSTADVVPTGSLCALVLTNDAHAPPADLPAAEVAGLPKGYKAWSDDAAAAAELLNDNVKARLAKPEPVKISVDKYEVKVYLRGICPSVSKMESAARLAVAIAGSTQLESSTR